MIGRRGCTERAGTWVYLTELSTPLSFLQLFKILIFCFALRADNLTGLAGNSWKCWQTADFSQTGRKIITEIKTKNDFLKKLEKRRWGQKSPEADAAPVTPIVPPPAPLSEGLSSHFLWHYLLKRGVVFPKSILAFLDMIYFWWFIKGGFSL